MDFQQMVVVVLPLLQKAKVPNYSKGTAGPMHPGAGRGLLENLFIGLVAV